MKVGIAIDSWKIKIFDKHLKDGFFKYEQHPGITEDTLTLTVETQDKEGLLKVVMAANTEAAKVKETNKYLN